ncbi:EAL domain-containing protein [Leptothrix ochracea]|uniref:EAL domain-containing protein n=1 Tax=Leptothrix ochracea TaxID=735331 RepID=UPI0034E1C115
MHISNLTLADILTRDVACIDIDASAEAARQQLCEPTIGAVVVLAGMRPVGVITGRDWVRGYAQGMRSVREVMGPMWVEPMHADYRGAYRRMVMGAVRLGVVVDAAGELAGIVTEENFMRHLGTEFLWHLRHVDQAMTQEVLVLEVPALASVALQQLDATASSCLVLMANGVPVGMLTERDWVRWLPMLQPDTPVTAIMSRPIETVQANASLVQAYDQMSARRMSQLVVLDGRGNLQGLLRRQDIVRLIYERWVERLQSQEQLHLLHAFLDHSSEAFFVSRVTDGRLVYVNQQCCTFSGYTQAELLRMRVQDISDIYTTDTFTERLQEYRRVGRLVFETKHRCADGRHVPVEVSLSYVTGPLGDHTVGVVRSLEERERIALSLLEAEDRWKFAIEATDRGVWDWHVQTDHIYLSPKWKGMLGFESDELPSQIGSWWSHIHPDDFAGVQEAIDRHVRGEVDVYRCDHRLRCKDGAYRWVQSRGKVVTRDAEGQALRMIGTHTDITERKRIDAELALRERMARSLLLLSQALERAQTLKEIQQAAQHEVQLILGLPRFWLHQLHDTQTQPEQRSPLQIPSVMGMLMASPSELICIADVGQEPRTALMADMGYQSMFGMSLCQNEVSLGVLGSAMLVHEEGRQKFSSIELEYLSSLGGRVAAALERVQVHAELQQAVEQLRASEAVLRHAQSIAEVGNWVCESDTGLFIDSGPLARALGREPHEHFTFEDLLNVVHPEDRLRVIQHWKPVPDRQPREIEFRYLFAGQIRWVQIRAEAQFNDANWITRVVGVSRDITKRRLAELIQRTRLAVLDRVVRADPLAQVLEEVAHRLEEVHAEWHVSIVLVMPDNRLHTVAAPTLPMWYTELVDSLTIGVGVGSCGTAAYLAEPVWVEDVQVSPYWQDFRAQAEQMGVRSCWSTPFKDEGGRVLGTFAVYRAHVGLPNQAEVDLLTEFVDIAALAVQRVRAGEALRQAAAVFESTHDGVLITDLNANIVAVNQAYCRITGYGEQALLGQSPSMLKSGRHDADFYDHLWADVRAQGYWQGEMWNRRRSGELYPQWLTINTVRDERGEPSHYVGICTDITRIKQSEQQLEHLAHYDPLTGLPNRLLAQSRLCHALERASAPQAGTNSGALAVLFIDLDRFKTVNDSLGHPAGDELLAGFARRIQALLSEVDTLARLGGDEFLLLLEDIQSPAQVAAQAQALLDALVPPFLLSSGQVLYVTASIGVSLYPEDGRSADELIQHADSAMYQSKAQGRNAYHFYTEALTQAAHERLELELQMRRALARDEFHLHYQPILPTYRDGWVGVEALLRWDCPGRGPVDPLRFITLAEETGLIVPLGAWVLRAACRQARQWLDTGQPLCVAVNLSARQFMQSDLVKTIAEILGETALPPQWLELEITESILMAYPEGAIETLRQLRALGLRLSIDDFGTGYSSLAYLTRFTVDKLKIDQSFVKGLPQQQSQLAIVRAIINMAHSLGMVTLAEGVENAAQYRALRRAGCDLMQGHWFSPALSADAVQQWVMEARERHTTCLVPVVVLEKDVAHTRHPRIVRKRDASWMKPN